VTRDRRAGLATLALLFVTASWGSTFFLIKDLLERVPVVDFLAVRFSIAAVALFLVAPRAVASLSPAARRQGAVLGLVYGVAQILQTYGLEHTAASVSGFVTGMYVICTPLLAAVLLHQRIGAVTWIAVVLAFAGLAVLSLRGFAVGYGEARSHSSPPCSMRCTSSDSEHGRGHETRTACPCCRCSSSRLCAR
jgi:drug/metabolite transporter (DMT)-like permease